MVKVIKRTENSVADIEEALNIAYEDSKVLIRMVETKNYIILYFEEERIK